ncbi:phage virion morphogenesis protein [Enterobacter hormaechei]|jgi:phage virion morphogenesis protein|uniref:phage virion morphogenesis protein n=2 Tax=Enterobacter hormaechei TaxID=158836 RepID=UPI0005EF8C21|nr:phage virion morphogenesis protein [Enterobacter hormaechei]ELX7457997.1 phage virion morphogenesis protein [Enterobacter hormaechei subsp. hoffmannii]EHN8718885.1 phage virion morphogenesis protein [Enterobacter hormaechei]EJV4648169.1 phage virion morphogenesis protein [Enterobacter hormaechei]ELC6309159.1 phage virion morphogenesis protein [Enterobacter hormaechei]ELD4167664.1 phage virion morphogenesis protein [Enterobacter hormaechei]
MSDFKPFDNQLAGLLAALSPAGRRKLAGEIAKQLRTAQQQRIKQQKAPDGSPYLARKRQPLRAKTGRIKRAMFQKLRTNRYMKASGRENSAVVEFTDKVQRIARVHQYGLKDRPKPRVHVVTYAERQLLGLSKNEIQLIEFLVINYLEML